ncbi:hypothetical protein J6590_020240 [Homalodisca vitripennis]|nr:hypothetical protein J6590_020240 [Homalodisca vitripennis]
MKRAPARELLENEECVQVKTSWQEDRIIELAESNAIEHQHEEYVQVKTNWQEDGRAPARELLEYEECVQVKTSWQEDRRAPARELLEYEECLQVKTSWQEDRRAPARELLKYEECVQVKTSWQEDRVIELVESNANCAYDCDYVTRIIGLGLAPCVFPTVTHNEDVMY